MSELVSDFSTKVAIVTGSTGALGGAVTRALTERGAKLVLLNRSADHLPRRFPELVDSPDYLLIGQTDLTDPDSVKRAFDDAFRHFGRFDYLINVAGGYKAGKPLHKTPVETLDFMLNLNARSVFLTCQNAIPRMIDSGKGKIVNVAARAANSGAANMSAYTASKGAVVRLTESMALELRDNGINVNCVLPGTIDTPNNRESMPNANFDRWVTPEAITDVILFLLSEQARAISGAAVPAYGRS